jgi:hypothetical protein
MGLKFSGCAINYEALVPRRNEPSVLLGVHLKFAEGDVWWSEQLKKCIIMHVCAGLLRKVHYSALFGEGKRRKKRLTQSRIPEVSGSGAGSGAETQRKE